jgi:hypothetical protein
MKRSVILLLLSSSFFHARAATYQETIAADQPTGYWRLGDPAGSTSAANIGSTGSAQNGNPILGVTFGSPGALAGDANTAVTFDAAQSKIDVPYSPQLNATNFTIEVWAKVLSGSTGHRSPLASRDDSPQRGYIFYATPSDTWEFWTGTGEQVGWNTVGGAAVELDAWAHLVGTFDGTNKLFYVNGVLVGGNQSRLGLNESKVLRIGASATESPVGDFFFAGDVDEVAVYNKAIAADRVLAHYTAGAGAPPAADVAPALALQPQALNRFKGESATLTAIATGSLPLNYQWKKNDVNIPGATNLTLVLTNLQPADAGAFTLEVSNAAGSVASDPAALAVADMSKPEITQQPRSRTVLPGLNASFSVSAIGSTTFGYQWLYNNQNILAATNSTLSISNVQTANLGSYKVVVSNAAGSTESAVATLQFPAPATTNYLNTVKQDNPVAYWRLDETTGDVADDEIGAHDGAYLNGVILGRPGAITGDTNPAAGFATAASTKVDVPYSEALNPPVFTAEVWAKASGTGVHRSPLTSRGDGPQRGYIFYADPGNTWQFWVGASEPLGWATLQGPAVQPGAYAHLVGVYDGTTMFFYVNGVLAGQRNVVLAPNDQNPLRIGGGATEGDGNFFFDGDVDEVAIYNTALSEERILAHYVAGFPLTTPPSITLQPSTKFALAGGNVTLTVAATGGAPLLYQWKFNNVNLPNATNSTLSLTNIAAANAGDYTVVVSNTGGSLTSQVARVVIPAAPAGNYVDLIKADAPVAYWRLGETQGDIAEDEIGANDGTYLNGVTLGAPGAVATDTNTAVTFTAASSQKLDVPWTDVINPPVFSAEIWARVTGGSGHRSPLTSRADSPQRGFIFYAEPGNTWQFWSGKGDQTGWDNLPGPAVQPNQWAHLVGTYDGTTKRFYVNGTEVGSRAVLFAPNDAAPLRIGAGASEGDGTFFFEGNVDEAAVYNKVLTPEQVILHYLAGKKQNTGPALSLARDSSGITLSWTSGTLQSTEALGTAWQNVTGAVSPYKIPSPTETAKFFRLSVP